MTSNTSPTKAQMTDNPMKAAEEAAAVINSAAGVDKHDIALVLGSGWGSAADLLGDTIAETPAAEVPGFHASVVAGHGGTLRSIRLKNSDKIALVLGARTHYYEGRGVRAVAHGVRTAAAAGADKLVLTNGCGSTSEEFAPGTPVIISDHLNLTAISPLEGANFVDLTDLYSPRLREVLRSVDPELKDGVYAQFPGPHYETPAEVRMARTLGADLVGMSTALEAIAARAAGLEVVGISLVTNLGAGVSATALSHAEVIEAGQAAGPRISALLAEAVSTMAELPRQER